MGGPYPNYTSDPLPTLDYIDTSAAPGATYDYVVTSIDSSGAESAYSNKVSATLTTTASDSASGLGSSTLDSPAISASPQQTTSPVQLAPLPVIHLSWTPSESAVAGYRVYRSLTQCGPYVDYDPGPLDAVSFDDSSVVPGATYFYVVTALDSEGDVSIYSNQVMTAPPAR
jgi:fibronectin type 3 domain-containing protein